METIELTPKQEKISDAIAYLSLGFLAGMTFMFCAGVYLGTHKK